MRHLLPCATLFALASLSSADVTIFDQYGTGAFNGNITSQIFGAPNSRFDSIAIDDFTIASSYTLTEVTLGVSFLSFHNDYASITGYKVSIFSAANAATAASLDGDVATINLLPASATPNLPTYYGAITLDLSSANVTLGPGTYFLGVTTALDFATIGQVSLTTSNLSDGIAGNSRLIRPNQSSPNGPNTLNGANPGYRLKANPVPEPATMAALGLGAAAMLRRRKKA